MSNKGFQIEIQEGLNKSEQDQAVKVANNFIKDWIEHDMSWKHTTRGGWSSFLRRGVLGHPTKTVNGSEWDDFGLYFRRASRGRRIFQIVKKENIKLKSDAVIGTHCICPDHEGGLKVATKYGEIKTKVYATIGDIKG